tara:strand:- start:1414 stop:1986 length:573 start_codon:yes stop_codon:yes gene_type:complete
MSDQSLKLEQEKPETGFWNKEYKGRAKLGFALVSTGSLIAGFCAISIPYMFYGLALSFPVVAGIALFVGASVYMAESFMKASEKMEGSQSVTLKGALRPRVGNVLWTLSAAFATMYIDYAIESQQASYEQALEAAIAAPEMTEQVYEDQSYNRFVLDQCRSAVGFITDDGQRIVTVTGTDDVKYRINCPS